MTSKPVLMIHEFREEFFDLPLEQYTLTFDDGLYSQFFYIDRLCELDTEKLFFISTNITCNTAQSNTFPSSREAHTKAFDGNTEDYMTIDQIKQLANMPKVTIGGHSHTHTNISGFGLPRKLDHIKQDTEAMLEWFVEHLGTVPLSFCFPYNDDLNGLYPAYLKKMGFSRFYGRERIPIETLL